MEITASRLLAPHFGTSILVWSNIIAVVLLCLAFGYYMGGRLADRKPNLEVLSMLSLISGMYFLFVPKLTSWLVNFGNTAIYESNPGNIGFFLTTFLVSFFLFGIPLIFLGMTSPLMVKIYNLSINRVGESTGIVFAVSTLGSILGTIIPTFWLLPQVGTTTSIFIMGGILLAIGLMFASIKKFVAIVVVLIAATLVNALPEPTLAYQVIHQRESPYHHIKVVEDKDSNRYMVFNEGLSLESVYKRDGSILTGGFYDYFNFLPLMISPESDKKVLIVGLAGATMPRQLNYFFGDQVEVDAVEIDEETVEVANEYFDLSNLKLNVFIDDGRSFLNQNEKKYDVIMVDVFQNELYIPWTFTTREFWELVSDRLNEQGIVAINVHASSNKNKLLELMANTQAAVFENVYLTDFLAGRGSSYMITASKQPLDFNLNQSLPWELAEIKQGLSHTKKIVYDSSKKVFTDDWAPIEQLTEHSVTTYRKQKLLK
ncbi:MAG TPA: fused MFS/spermidine synthase [Verrucomicrobiae bacterium]|nr:fused MFS/spermidine synthase [Verrucomicrobiae bacterium]